MFEELDAPKEWFLERKTSTLFFAPPPGADPRRMIFEAVTLKNLIQVRGSAAVPVRHLTFRGLFFRCAGYTYMQTDNVPSGGIGGFSAAARCCSTATRLPCGHVGRKPGVGRDPRQQLPRPVRGAGLPDP